MLVVCCCLLFVVCGLLLVVCRLLFVVWLLFGRCLVAVCGLRFDVWRLVVWLFGCLMFCFVFRVGRLAVLLVGC